MASVLVVHSRAPFEDAPSRKRPRAVALARPHLCVAIALSSLLISSASGNMSPVLQQTASALQQAYPAPPAPAAGYPPQQAAAPQQNGYGAIPQQPPLVTYETMEKAKELEPGLFIDELSHKSQIRSAALARQLHAYRGVSPWFFVFTFLATVGTIIVAFFYVKDIWSKRQEDSTGLG